MRTLIEAAPDTPAPATLIALLTGTFSEPEDFVREGFPAAARAHGVEAEIVMAEVRGRCVPTRATPSRAHTGFT